jgi:hypothetical protein
MTKIYIDTLAEWVKKRETVKSRRDRHWVAFLAIKADVEAVIEAGYALRTIWEHMKETGKITYRYETLLKHVNKLNNIGKTTGKSGGEEMERKKQSIELGSFTFNAVPKKEDLF